MSLLKATLACALAAASISMLAAEAAAQDPEFRYFTPYSRIVNQFDSGGDVAGYKLCTTEDWSLETSGHPERFEKVAVVISSTPETAIEGAAAGYCEFVGLRWDVEADRGAMESALADWHHEPIPPLNND